MIWNGQVKDLEARDPKGSNVLYSALVGRPSLSSVKEGHPAPSVALTFRYAKERGVGDLTSPYITRKELAPVGSPASEAPAPKASGISGPWESSVLSLSLTELQAVYVQPLWLEFIDFLWEGVLGTAVWGGSVEPETARGASKSGEGVCGKERREGRVLRRRSVSGIAYTTLKTCGRTRPCGEGEGVRDLVLLERHSGSSKH